MFSQDREKTTPRKCNARMLRNTVCASNDGHSIKEIPEGQRVFIFRTRQGRAEFLLPSEHKTYSAPCNAFRFDKIDRISAIQYRLYLRNSLWR